MCPPDGEVRRGTPGWRLKTFLRPLIAASDLQRERTRLAAAQADIAELEAARKRGELLPADEVQRADEAVFSAIRDAFLALPAALADQLCEVAAAEAAAGIDRVLRERIEEVLVDAFEMEFEDEEE